MVMKENIWDQITLVFVAHHSSYHIERLLNTLETPVKVAVSVTDGSDDMQKLQAKSHHQITIIKNEFDLGVTTAYNQAIAAAKTPFALQLNPDVDFSTECIAELLNLLHTNENAACAGPLLVSGNKNKSFVELDLLGPGEHRHQKATTIPEGPFCTWFIPGAVLLWRVDAFKDVGGLDENIYIYGDDVDICIRTAKKGYSMILTPEVSAYHIGGEAAGKVTLARRLQKTRKMTWGHLYMERKYSGVAVSKSEARKIKREKIQKILLSVLSLNLRKAVGHYGALSAASDYLNGVPFWGVEIDALKRQEKAGAVEVIEPVCHETQ